MSAAPDSLVVTGPVNQQVSIGNLLVTPVGGTQTALADLLNGGTIANTGTFSTLTVTGFALESVGAAISSAGSSVATGTTLAAQVNNVTTTTSGQFVVLPLAANVVGASVLILNNGTAACTVGGQGGDTIDNTAGTTGVTLTNAHRCFFSSIATNKWISGPEGGVTS